MYPLVRTWEFAIGYLMGFLLTVVLCRVLRRRRGGYQPRLPPPRLIVPPPPPSGRSNVQRPRPLPPIKPPPRDSPVDRANRHATLPKYSGQDCTCPKCGTVGPGRVYRECEASGRAAWTMPPLPPRFATEYQILDGQPAKGECLLRTCPCCGHTWREQIEDSLPPEALNPPSGGSAVKPPERNGHANGH